MDKTGRPLEMGDYDNQEIQRRFQVEDPDDYNNRLVDENKQFNDMDKDKKVPLIKGDKTILCWNCQSVLLVKDEWSVVQCTNCEKVNKVPGMEDINSQIKLNDNLNHFDIKLPYVFILITCPFCKTENKARRDAEHLICYKCHNSCSILQDRGNRKEPSQMSNINPGNRIQRSNDQFFPQPPFPWQYPYPPYYPPITQDSLEKQIENLMKLEMLKNKKERKIEPKIRKNGALIDLIRTVNDINEYRGTIMKNDKGIYENTNNDSYYKDSYRNDKLYESPLKSKSVYKNILDKNEFLDSYKDFKNKGKSKFEKFDFKDFILSSVTNNKKY